jgi:CheY-like chemotaxis protein
VAYYLFDGKAAIGPFEAAELLKRPDFGPATLVFPVGATGADAWKRAADFPDLAPPPPPTAPPSKPALSEITLTMAVPRKLEPPPAAEPAPAAEAPAPAPAAGPVSSPDRDVAPLAKPSEKSVLIIDDDDSVRSFLEMCAQSAGFQVFTAGNGLEATAVMAAHPADLIVTDLMMPGQGGYEFLRGLQAQGHRRLPVFVVTGSVLDASTVAMIKSEANVVEFVPKPVNMRKFIAALHEHLRTEPK